MNTYINNENNYNLRSKSIKLSNKISNDLNYYEQSYNILDQCNKRKRTDNLKSDNNKRQKDKNWDLWGKFNSHKSTYYDQTKNMWVSPSSVKNFMVNDPVVDWYKLYNYGQNQKQLYTNTKKKNISILYEQ